MSSTQDTRSAQPVSETFAGPGAQLRRARENHRLSVEAVAGQLRVLPKIIAALETDDYASLPSPVYVRGYLRSYARVVSLSPEPLIESYNRFAGTESSLTTPVPEDTGERPMRWGTYLAVLAVLASAVLWVNRDGLVRYWSEPRLPADETAAVPPPAESVAGVTEPAATAEPPLPVTIVEKPQETPVPVAAAAPAKPAEADTASAPTPQPEAQPVIGQGPDSLTVRISKDSWVAIRDASGQRLVYGTLAAGTVKSLRGQAPFALVLGNATAAQVEFNGQSVDHSKYTVGAVARFKIVK